MIDFLNANSGVISIFFTAIVTAATAVYAILTWILVTETRRMREAQTEPILEIIVKPLDISINLIRIHVRNIGLGGAHEVAFKTSIISGGLATQSLANEMIQNGPIANGIRYLGPSLEKFTQFASINPQNESGLDGSFEIMATWKSPTGKMYSAPFLIDLSEMRSEYRVGDPPIIEAAKSLTKIANDIHELKSGFKKLQIDLYTKDDRESDRIEYLKRVVKSKEKEQRSKKQ